MEREEDRRFDFTSRFVLATLPVGALLIDGRYRRASLSSLSHVLLRNLEFGCYCGDVDTRSSGR